MRLILLASAAICLAGCGYVGDPMPPALNIPVPVADFRAVQVADKIIIDYTAPELTTDDVGLTAVSTAEVLIGADSVPVIAPKPGEPSHLELPASKWVGQKVAVRVVLSGPKGKRSEESNAVTLKVEQPLTIPVNVKAESHPDGVRVSWTSPDARATRFKIVREPEAQAVVESPEYIDRAVETGKEYKYRVASATATAESLASAPVAVIPRDIFAPAVPSNVNAVVGVTSIELAWDRSPEPDLRGYRVYRNDAVVAENLDAPAYSDRQVVSGQRYRYTISAVDRTGNESAKSAPIEATAP